jgi:hypothetical protein
VLISKNRDAPAKEIQKLAIITPTQGYRYLGLVYKKDPADPLYDYLSAGINEKGLTIVDNDADIKTKDQDAKETVVMTDILTNYDSVAAVIKDQKKLFTHNQVNYILIADPYQIALIEIAPNGEYAIRTATNGMLWHTNFYANVQLAKYNQNLYIDSIDRYNRIDYLLHHHRGRFDMNDNEQFARDRADGDKNSILRNFTVASWFVKIPKNAAPTIKVKLFNPLQVKQNFEFTLDENFWHSKILNKL